jgi:hypothetical protein
MAVFISASDETMGATQDSIFHYCGYVMPEDDWTRYFIPAWSDRVLTGPPDIPYLHMTEIRSPRFREKLGLSRKDADDRVAEACRVIRSMGSIFPVRSTLHAGIFLKTCGKRQWRNNPTQKAKKFEVDYVGFLGYVYLVLLHISEDYPDAEKVDFVIGIKSGISNHIQEFYSGLPQVLRDLGKGHLTPLMGTIIPGDIERIPIQAADVLCWHTQRAQLHTLDRVGMHRISQLVSGGGYAHDWTNKEIHTLDRALARRIANEAKNGIRELRPDNEAVNEGSPQRHKSGARRGKSSKGGSAKEKRAAT